MKRFHPITAVLLAALVTFTLPCIAQKNASPDHSVEKSTPRQPDPEAQKLVQDILSQSPSKPVTFEGVLKRRDADGKRSEIPIRYAMIPEEGGWRAVYEARATARTGGERLEIVHHHQQPNRYLHSSSAGPGQAPGDAVVRDGRQTATPFAHSDYWLSDLGMEFLHWPEQRLLRDARIKMRQGRPCKVLESVSPDPATTGYARVVSWLDAESGAPIYAEARDAMGTRLKIFSLRGFKKVNDRWQPKEMEMWNDKEDSMTTLEFSTEVAG
jgi:hypothetical protein